MPRQAPYLQRRGDVLYFRIAVPVDIRPHIGWREITKTLGTTERNRAIPAALEYAALVKRTFYEFRAAMTNTDETKLMALVDSTRHKLDLDDARNKHQEELDNLHVQHNRELKQARAEARAEALEGALVALSHLTPTTPSPGLQTPPAASKRVPTVFLKEVISGFLKGYGKKKPAMLRKLNPVLNMFLEIVGDKPIADIYQQDINDFFNIIVKLPPEWVKECRQRKLSIRELAELDFAVTIAPKTFKSTYIACIRPFLIASKLNFQDKGFPLGLTIDGIKYDGDREEDEDAQRSFNQEELIRLFEGEEMRGFAENMKLHHRYWLLHLGLFTGARVNEICQINPQADILQDEKGIWYLWITKDTESDPRVKKSVKTKISRKVPVHQKLIDLGFLSYVDRVKAAGHKLLFPEWKPVQGRASGEAQKWVYQFFRDTNLRDETPKECILGMHAFRHTLLTHGAMQEPPLSLFCITGHEQKALPIPATGAGRIYLTSSLLSPLCDRAALLNKLKYKLSFITVT
jgi:integrase